MLIVFIAREDHSVLPSINLLAIVSSSDRIRPVSVRKMLPGDPLVCGIVWSEVQHAAAV